MMTETVQNSTSSIYRFIALLKSLSKSDLVNYATEIRFTYLYCVCASSYNWKAFNRTLPAPSMQKVRLLS